MNSDQQMISWLAVFALIIGVWLVYRQQLSAILFATPGSGGVDPTGGGGNATIPPSATGQTIVGSPGSPYGPPGSGLSGTLQGGGTLLNPPGGGQPVPFP